MKIPSKLLAAVALTVLLSACSRDPAWLVERTLDAREAALKSKDLKTYAALFHPDYQYQPGETETNEARMQKHFAAHDKIILRTNNRRITFEQNGEIARVVQEYQLMTEYNGKTFKTSGTENFLLKRKKTFFKTEYLFYQGLGS
jgi:hypothetical protein